MSNENPNRICGNCLHFIQRDAQCRKYVPRGGERRAWPSVVKEDWCGEFEGKPSGKKGHVYDPVG